MTAERLGDGRVVQEEPADGTVETRDVNADRRHVQRELVRARRNAAREHRVIDRHPELMLVVRVDDEQARERPRREQRRGLAVVAIRPREVPKAEWRLAHVERLAVIRASVTGEQPNT